MEKNLRIWLIALVVCCSALALPAGAVNEGKIAYQFSHNGVWVINPDGTGQTQLTGASGTYLQNGDPAWSPDGKKIALFLVDTGSLQPHIYVMNADGTDVTQRTFGDQFDESPTWSPNGTMIAFSSHRGSALAGIYVMNADGTGPVQLTSHLNQFDINPAWSPDGTKIAYATSTDGGVYDDYQICMVKNDGTDLGCLTSGTGVREEPAWSPDGTKIAFEYCPTHLDTDKDIYVMNADGSGMTALTTNPGFDGEPAWSPDGSTILFSHESADGTPLLYVMNADGTGQKRLADTDIPGEDPSWAPLLAVTVPNGGEEWKQGTLHTIRWSCPESTPATVKIELLKAGSVDRVITPGTPGGSGGEGSYTWTVPLNQAAGTDYRIRVTGTDDGTYADTGNADFTISAGIPPVANAGPDRAVLVNQPVRFDGSGSADPDGSIVAYAWDFKDTRTGSGRIVTHSYTTAGTYAVMLTVTDDSGLTGSDTAVITVRTASQGIDDLKTRITSLRLPSGIRTAFTAELSAAQVKIRQGKYLQAKQILQAFIAEVGFMKKAKILSGPVADELIASARTIISALP